MTIMTYPVVVSSSQSKILSPRPNILLLITDDQDVTLGSTSHMPLLHQYLTQQGTTFANSFVHTPICCPSRSSILSGRYIHNGGAINNSGYAGNCYGKDWRNNAERLTFAVYAKQAGYQTAYSGKYLNAYGENGVNTIPPGWDKWLGQVGNSLYYNYSVVMSDEPGATKGQRIDYGDNYATDYFSDLIANRTLDLIQEFTSNTTSNNNSSRPFLIVTAWPAPHTPDTPAPWALGFFNRTTTRAPRTPNWNASNEFVETKHYLVRKQSPLDDATVQNSDQSYSRRLETLLSVDQHVEKFVKLLEKQNVLDNTIIIYTSDNGFHHGQFRMPSGKRQLYEDDIRVPFIVRGPSIPKNVTVYNQLVLNIDIAPTIYHVIKGTSQNYDESIPLPETMDGISFLPVVATSQQIEQKFSNSPTNPPLRKDFLVRYQGDRASCKMTVTSCPVPPPYHYHLVDLPNNTYHCLRYMDFAPTSANITTTIGTVRSQLQPLVVFYGEQFMNKASSSSSDPGTVKTVDYIYCRFDDDESFVEFYDLMVDPWQLENLAFTLSPTQTQNLQSRLAQLQACRGETCRLSQFQNPLQASSATPFQQEPLTSLGNSWYHSTPWLSTNGFGKGSWAAFDHYYGIVIVAGIMLLLIT